MKVVYTRIHVYQYTYVYISNPETMRTCTLAELLIHGSDGHQGTNLGISRALAIFGKGALDFFNDALCHKCGQTLFLDRLAELLDSAATCMYGFLTFVRM